MSVSTYSTTKMPRRSNEAIPDSLYQVKLLSALRSGDPAQIHPFLADIGSSKDSDLGALALHLAVRCASCDTISLLLSHRSISPNAVYPHGSGTTALHLAASLARDEVVLLLLDQDGIDDTLRDSEGRTCLQVAKGKQTIRAIKDSHAFFIASYKSLLRAYIFSPPNDRMPDALTTLLSSPRSRLLDLSYLDDSSGTTLLHEAAKRKDLRAVELAVRAGADVFVRDRRGKTVYESVGKDDRVKAFLKQFANQDTTLMEPPSTEPPELKGYLNKYANVAKGYSVRYFVLSNGVLSYYRNQDEENIASRGSIAMKTASLKNSPGSGGLRFEVYSTPSRGHTQAAQKWYLRANHPVEASRWIQALGKSIEYAQREEARKSGESESPSLRPPSTRTTPSLSYARSPRVDLSGSAGASSGGASITSSIVGDDLSEHHREGNGEPPLTDTEHDGKENEDSSMEESERFPPHDKAFDLQGNSAVAQAELTSQMLSSYMTSPSPTHSPDVRHAILDSVSTLRSMLADYVHMVTEREEWWKDELKREKDRQQVWEESLRVVVQEGEQLETELRNKSRRRSRLTDSSFVSVSEMGTLKNRPSKLALASPPILESEDTLKASPAEVPATATTARQVSMSRTGTVGSQRSQRSGSGGGPRPFSLIMVPTSPSAIDEDALADTDEEDEFFDAIESNTLPNLVVNEQLTGQSIVELPPVVNTAQFDGYANLRSNLSISTDDRPPMSLWAVLKNSIGKDLTKISFPVFFNEPTSMLQRMAEDMEFSECLDAAAAEEDPHRRIAFVAAFAMSNYSSTIGRIAKPFNPMLSETFEYVRLDKKYRYMSEQVSHHPPMSACWAESPCWRYFGEVDAQNKFMGKSFEIRPTGVAHAEVLLPKDKYPSYPKAKGAIGQDKVVEHYSWKKVTTNISGFILGSPTIDHYGEMVVTNHRTGDQCVLTFKPRGWRGRDAFEISGYVADSHGEVTYEIAGRWNSQLVARAVGTGAGQLHPDVTVGGPSSPSTPMEYILLWRNSEKPVAPFNLTPYAITLNDCPDTLKPYLCPTDCRLRPDQRAFELGKYERANDLKGLQEDFQRITRKAREEGRAPAHKPRWFSAETEPDTGERVWTPARVEDDKLEYWVERERIWQEKTLGRKGVAWKNVDRIFIDDEP